MHIPRPVRHSTSPRDGDIPGLWWWMCSALRDEIDAELSFARRKEGRTRSETGRCIPSAPVAQQVLLDCTLLRRTPG